MKTYKSPKVWRWLPVGSVTVGIGALVHIFPRSDPAKEFEKFTATVERIDITDSELLAGKRAPSLHVYHVTPARSLPL